MKNWKTKFGRQIISTITSLAFLNSHLAFAISNQGGDPNHWVNQSSGLIRQLGGAMIGAAQNEAFARQQAAMMQSMQPKPTPSLFFKHCMVGPAKAPVPENMCSNISSPQQLQSIEGGTMAAILQNISFYDQLLSEATNNPTPPGIKCLTNAQARLDTQMQQQLNSLEELMNQVKERSEQFRNFADAAKARMAKTRDELEGGGEAASKDFAKEFDDPACKDVIPNINIVGQSKGYNALAKGFDAPISGSNGQSLRTMSDNLRQNSGKIRANINNQIARIKNDIYKRGVDDFIKSEGKIALGSSKLSIGSVNTSIQNKIRDFNVARDRIVKELQIVGYELPPFDSNFDKNAQTFARGAKDFFEKKFVDECVTMKRGNGAGLSNQQVLDSIKQTSTNNRGTTIIAYKKTLSNILNSDATIQDKMDAIQKLDADYNGSNIVISVTNEQAQTVTTSTYQLYGDLINRCRQVYAQDNTFSTNNPNKISDKEQVARAKKSLDEIVNLNRQFATDLAADITNSVDNCASAADATLQGSCGAETLNLAKPGFCLSEAQQCSSNIVACQQKVAAKVATKRKSIQAEAVNYNAEFEKLMNFQKAHFRNFKAVFVAQRDQLAQFLPGADFELKEDTFIKTPGVEDNGELGSDLGSMAKLIGGGKLNFLDELPSKLRKMKETLAEQKAKANQSIQKHIDDQRIAMEANRKQWERVKNSCQEAAKNFRAEIDKRNAEGAKAAGEKEQEVAEFCKRYNGLTETNPGAGCNDVEELYKDSSKVAAFINPGVSKDIGKYRAMCSNIQTEGSADNKSTSKDIVKLCEEKGNDWNAVVSSLLSRAVAAHNAKLSKEERAEKKVTLGDISELTDFLNSGKAGSIPEKFRGGNLERQVQALASMNRTKIGSSGGSTLPTISTPATTAAPAGKTLIQLNKEKSDLNAKKEGIIARSIEGIGATQEEITAADEELRGKVASVEVLKEKVKTEKEAALILTQQALTAAETQMSEARVRVADLKSKKQKDNEKKKSEQSAALEAINLEIKQKENEITAFNAESDGQKLASVKAAKDKADSDEADRKRREEAAQRSGGNICLNINDAIEARVKANLAESQDKNTDSKQQAERESIKKNPGDKITGVTEINGKLSSFDSEMVGDIASDWSDLGEDATSCRAMTIGQRNMFDFMGGNIGQPNGAGNFNFEGAGR